MLFFSFLLGLATHSDLIDRSLTVKKNSVKITLVIAHYFFFALFLSQPSVLFSCADRSYRRCIEPKKNSVKLGTASKNSSIRPNQVACQKSADASSTFGPSLCPWSTQKWPSSRVSTEFCLVWWHFTGFLPSFTEFGVFVPGFTGLWWVKLGYTGFYWVLVHSIGFYWVLLEFT